MDSPTWLTGTFAALMLTVAAYCAGRLFAARCWQRPTELDTDLGHVLMGIAMAGMLVARLHILSSATWEVIFALGAGWFSWQLLQSRRHTPPTPWRCRHPAPHLVECAAMLYMLRVLPPLAAGGAQPSMTGMSASAAGSRSSFLALLTALFMFAYVVWVADRLPARAHALALPPDNWPPAPAAGIAAEGVPASAADNATDPHPSRPLLAPRSAALYKIAMGMTMGYMLITMM